jgi:acetolactate synthase-1/2/3 large subunit
MAMLPVEGGVARFAIRDELGLARPAWPDPADAKTVARWLIDADDPVIIVGKLGRNPEAVPALVRLAELLAVPVTDREESDGLSFPHTHDLFNSGPEPKDADALLIFNALVPYLPALGPQPNAHVARVDPDPVKSRYKFVHNAADLWITADPGAAATAIYDAATQLLTQSNMSRIEERRARLQRARRERDAYLEELAQKAGQRRPLHPRWVAYQLCKVLDDRAILIDDTLSGRVGTQAYHRRTEPRTYFKASSSAGGWGPGASFGAKIAAPDRDVVLATGDGYFMFGSPMQALWSAAHYKAPYLTVIWVNRAWTTGTTGLKASYPEGVTVDTGNYEGGTFDPPPDFAKLAETVNGYGETVREPEELAPALQRGLQHVRNGSPAIIACWLPTPIEELQLGS